MHGTLLEDYFARYGWAVEMPDEGIWRGSFAIERDEEFDLYVMANDEWVHFAVSPLVAAPDPACLGRLYAVLLRLNQQMRLVYFAVDEDGDVNLLAELPRPGFGYVHFASVLDALTAYTDALAYELQRTAHEPGYHSPVLPAP
jgi:hypothetical protein